MSTDNKRVVKNLASNTLLVKWHEKSTLYVHGRCNFCDHAAGREGKMDIDKCLCPPAICRECASWNPGSNLISDLREKYSRVKKPFDLPWEYADVATVAERCPDEYKKVIAALEKLAATGVY